MRLIKVAPFIVVVLFISCTFLSAVNAGDDDDLDFKAFTSSDNTKILARGGGGHGGGHFGGGRSGGGRSFSRGSSRSSSRSSRSGVSSSSRRSSSVGASKSSRRGSSLKSRSQSSRSQSRSVGKKGGARGSQRSGKSSLKSGKMSGAKGAHGSKSAGKRGKYFSHHGGHGGRGGHHGGHHGHGYHHHGWHGHYWGGWWAASAFWGGVYFGLWAFSPFWAPWGPYWGPYWAAPWYPGLYWYPRYSYWYWKTYDCWLMPAVGMGYEVVFPNLGYYWYPSRNVSIYIEAPENEDAPSKAVYVENEDDYKPVYYAVYRKVMYNNSSYIIRVGSPRVLNTNKIVKVYLPSEESEDNEYVVITKRDKDELKENMDEKGNDLSPDIVDQIKTENAELHETKTINTEENISEEELQELHETRKSARENAAEIKKGLKQIKSKKDKLPSEEEISSSKQSEGGLSDAKSEATPAEV